jgi:hypothetical protein
MNDEQLKSALAQVPPQERSYVIIDGQQELCFSKRGIKIFCDAVARLDPERAKLAQDFAMAVESWRP